MANTGDFMPDGIYPERYYQWWYQLTHPMVYTYSSGTYDFTVTYDNLAKNMKELKMQTYKSLEYTESSDDENLYYKIELPGIKPEEITVTLFPGTTKIRVDVKKDDALAATTTFQVFTQIINEKISSKLDLGILTITCPRSTSNKPRNIPVS